VKLLGFCEITSSRSTHKNAAKKDSYLWKPPRALETAPHSFHTEVSGCSWDYLIFYRPCNEAAVKENHDL
jgi:hypothetical protein